MTKHNCPMNKSVIQGKQIITGCDECLDTRVRESEGYAKHNREWQKKHYRKDLIQPFERDFVKAYGADVARERGFSEDDIRRLS